MPRPDKVEAFRQAAGENRSFSYQEDDAQTAKNSKPEPEKLNKEQESKIDFSLYLREPKYTFEDVILPAATRHQVDLMMAELEHQKLIYEDWGMGEKHKLDKSLSINFYGPPGTGKTLTAEVIAHALNRKIIVVPYQQLESKYVGETPKNISDVFKFATEKNAILFFDEADSFLGKRLENVTQAVDTAVNLTRSVMLTELSKYEGVVIFATNLYSNYDPAFVSRIRRTIKFELPDEDGRVKIWEAQIPEKLPKDDSVDFTELAKEFKEISGRDIKNAVFQGVVAAAHEKKADSEKKVTQEHFTKAISEIIEANKAAEKSQYQFVPRNDEEESQQEEQDTASEPTNGKVENPSEQLDTASNN